MITIESAKQLTRENLVSSSAEKKQDHIWTCHETIRWLVKRLDEEIECGHRACTHSNCESSGVDCPAKGRLGW